MEGTVTISKKEYLGLRMAEETLYLLEGAGVDNWGGYEDAFENESWDEMKERIRKEIEEM